MSTARTEGLPAHPDHGAPERYFRPHGRSDTAGWPRLWGFESIDQTDLTPSGDFGERSWFCSVYSSPSRVSSTSAALSLMRRCTSLRDKIFTDP